MGIDQTKVQLIRTIVETENEQLISAMHDAAKRFEITNPYQPNLGNHTNIKVNFDLKYYVNKRPPSQEPIEEIMADAAKLDWGEEETLESLLTDLKEM